MTLAHMVFSPVWSKNESFKVRRDGHSSWCPLPHHLAHSAVWRRVGPWLAPRVPGLLGLSGGRAILASYALSRTLVPTLAMYLLQAQHHGSVGSRNPFTRFQQAFERGFARLCLEGADLDGNRQVANQPLTDLRQVPGLIDLRIQQPLDSPNFEVAVDRTKAAQGGFTVRDIASS